MSSGIAGGRMPRGKLRGFLMHGFRLAWHLLGRRLPFRRDLRLLVCGAMDAVEATANGDYRNGCGYIHAIACLSDDARLGAGANWNKPACQHFPYPVLLFVLFVGVAFAVVMRRPADGTGGGDQFCGGAATPTSWFWQQCGLGLTRNSMRESMPPAWAMFSELNPKGWRLIRLITGRTCLNSQSLLRPRLVSL